jgi:hypothetical protein
MKAKLSPQELPRQRQPTPTVTDRPRLWPNLTPAQRQQLAQCLAELIRRQRQARPTAPAEAPHEPC